jgi:ankyrin repeat protein
MALTTTNTNNQYQQQGMEDEIDKIIIKQLVIFPKDQLIFNGIIYHSVEVYDRFISKYCLKEDINFPDSFNDTALHWAVQYNKNTLHAEILIKNGADVNAINADGKTPLHIASERKETTDEFIKLLLKSGAIEIRDMYGNFPKYNYLFEKQTKSANIMV